MCGACVMKCSARITATLGDLWRFDGVGNDPADPSAANFEGIPFVFMSGDRETDVRVRVVFSDPDDRKRIFLRATGVFALARPRRPRSVSDRVGTPKKNRKTIH